MKPKDNSLFAAAQNMEGPICFYFCFAIDHRGFISHELARRYSDSDIHSADEVMADQQRDKELT